jgi:HD-GYP domain-containing protein (c-di-GMP phosphodiesterase class II)
MNTPTTPRGHGRRNRPGARSAAGGGAAQSPDVGDETLRRQVRLTEAMFGQAITCLALLDRDFRFVNVNHAFAFNFRRDTRNFAGHRLVDLIPGIEPFRSASLGFLNDVVKTAKPLQRHGHPYRFAEQPERGVTYWDWILQPVLDEHGQVEFLFFSANEVTERERAQEDLREKNQHAQSLLRLSRHFEHAQTYEEILNAAFAEVKAILGYQRLWVYLLTEDGNYADAFILGGPAFRANVARLNIKGDRMLEEIAEARDIVLVEDARTDPRVNKEIVAQNGNRTIINVPIVLIDRHLGSMGTGTFDEEGVKVPTSLQEQFLKAMASQMAVSLDRIHSLNQRQQAEQDLALTNAALRRVNRALKTLSSGNEALIRADNEPELVQNMCRVLVEIGGYRAAWIGFAEDNTARSLTLAAWAGVGGDRTDFSSSWRDSSSPSDPAGTAIRTGRTRITHDIATDPEFVHWREEALKNDFRSSLSIPLKTGPGLPGVLTIFSHESEAFDPDEVALMVELTDDLAYGIHALRTRREKEQGLTRLQETMEATIQALASTVELRDPYTAGHQQRVAKLAVSIARALALPEERVRGLFLAGIVHDVGKIFIPAEVLSRPGKLSSVEFELVKTHVEAGCEILKSIDFPWPIESIVRQHHERLDGSGYPGGLKGDAILLEARILSVSDVVEAMFAHRPYRAGLGIGPALAEIERGRGTLYDPAVVDACMALFRERDFRFD